MVVNKEGGAPIENESELLTDENANYIQNIGGSRQFIRPSGIFDQPPKFSLFLPSLWSFQSKWVQGSLEKLVQAEFKLLKRVNSHITSRYVPVRHCSSLIYTITVKPKSVDSEVPFVLIPGFAAGVGVWAANLDALASKRTVHAFDTLGFGRSSRPQFSDDPTLAELEFVQSIEDWRKAMGIEKMILIGHSFGGFLASSYTLEYPQRVRHLVLIDPLMFTERPSITEKPHIPFYQRVMTSLFSRLCPLAALRMAGPYGVVLVKWTRSDLQTRYPSEDEPNAIYEYVFQCSAQNPTGELAFVTMTKHYGWARRPMIRRFTGIPSYLPTTFIYGAKTYMTTEPAIELQSRRPESYVALRIVPGAGHHVYADRPDEFNALIQSISDLVDRGEDVPEKMEAPKLEN